jgi:hypothetical protein
MTVVTLVNGTQVTVDPTLPIKMVCGVCGEQYVADNFYYCDETITCAMNEDTLIRL